MKYYIWEKSTLNNNIVYAWTLNNHILCEINGHDREYIFIWISRFLNCSKNNYAKFSTQEDAKIFLDNTLIENSYMELTDKLKILL
jgi:hypothetical protein